MTAFILGLALWSAAQPMPRLAPGLHACLGCAARPVVALGVLAELWLTIRGYADWQAEMHHLLAPWGAISTT